VDFYVDVFDSPFQGFFVGGEEDVQAVSTDGAAAVEDLNGLIVVVAGYDHFSAEGESFVSGCEGITFAYFVAAGRYAVGEFSAASSAGAISSYAHSDGLPLAGRLRGGVHFRSIEKDYRRQDYSGENLRA
jgi:hypothetical protein